MFTYINYVKYLTFPAQKSSLIDRANELHLPAEFIHELDKLPDHIYNSTEELLNEYELYK
ncbi:MAG: hypothetical protein ACD_20C00186G0001 [uncultured bacterium]|nr:MAG: hypothetical protein ACD_20C00186G0001 [uncultured bacterium]